MLEAGIFDKCTIFFSKYYTVFEQVAASYEFLSYNEFIAQLLKRRKASLFVNVPVSCATVELVNVYFYNICLIVPDALEEHKYSELGCRAFSMEMAHRNATEPINEKMMLYNKARQAEITNAILEVISGATHTK